MHHSLFILFFIVSSHLLAQSDINNIEYNNGNNSLNVYCPDNLNLNWSFQYTETSHSIMIDESSTESSIFGQSIEFGDWIGVFYEINGEFHCSGYIVWEGITTLLLAYGNNNFTEEKDGFDSGDTFVWMVWDQSENTTINLNASYNSFSIDTLFNVNGLTYVEELSRSNISEQEVSLNVGWNMFSTYITGENISPQTVFEDFQLETVIMKDNYGNAYMPQWSYYGVEQLIPGQGYQAKMTANCNLFLEGTYLCPEDNPILLTEGWNMIAYLRTNPSPTNLVFEDVNNLVIVKDNIGMVHLPEFDYNGIGVMLPGQGYQVKVTSNQTLQYLPNSENYE